MTGPAVRGEIEGMVLLRSRGAGCAIRIPRAPGDAGPGLSEEQLLPLSLSLNNKGQLPAPRADLTKFIRSSSHPNPPRKESIIALCRPGVGRVKKHPSAAGQTLKWQRDIARSPPGSSPHTLPPVFCGTAAPTGGKGPSLFSPRCILAGSSSRRGRPPLRNLAIITHSFFF